MAREIRKRQYWSVEQMRQWQNDHVRHLVSHAAEAVPFYRERFRRLGIVPDRIKTIEDLRQIPPTTKEDIQQHFPDRMTARTSQ